MVTLRLISSSVVGSHGKPGWWFAAVNQKIRALAAGAELAGQQLTGNG